MRPNPRLTDISLSEVDAGIYKPSIPFGEHLKMERKAAQYLPRIPI